MAVSSVVTGGVWAKGAVVSCVHTHARVLSPTQCHHLQEGTESGVMLSLLRRRFKPACPTPQPCRTQATDCHTQHKHKPTNHACVLCCNPQKSWACWRRQDSEVRCQSFLGCCSCAQQAFTTAFTQRQQRQPPQHIRGCVPCGCLCCAGEVALTRAADEESLQILHVWRGA